MCRFHSFARIELAEALRAHLANRVRHEARDQRVTIALAQRHANVRRSLWSVLHAELFLRHKLVREAGFDTCIPALPRNSVIRASDLVRLPSATL